MNMIINNEGKTILKTNIQGSEITVRFSGKPNPQVKDNIVEILTSCYDWRVQTALNSVSAIESA